MARRYLVLALVLITIIAGSAAWLVAQKAPGDDSVIRVDVDMVQMNVAVTDKKGKYVTGLHPQDFQIVEDNAPQQLATFEEGNEAPINLIERSRQVKSDASASQVSVNQSPAQPDQKDPLLGADVFILFDSSDYMYKDFAFAQDSMVNFVRTLDNVDRIAFYSYSRDFSRAVRLTADRSQVMRGIHTAAAGADAALYGAMLLTLRDASQYSGRKVMVVFSHGPDNASMVSPEEVGELAQSEGVPIYMVSTRETNLDPISTTVFQRMSASTGGEAYFARNWQDEQKVFNSIKDDLAHVYTLSYYPGANPNHGWRTIKVKLVGQNLKNLNIRTRNGYRPSRASIGRASPEGQ
jgi:Ca-activated chloride channel family protein